MSPPSPIPTLVVGDHAAIADLLPSVLDQLGIRPVEHAANGAAALALVNEKPFALIISDWSMEPVSGLQLLKFVRAEKRLAELRFVIALPEDSRALDALARQAGADGVLIEPWSRDSIARAIRNLFVQT